MISSMDFMYAPGHDQVRFASLALDAPRVGMLANRLQSERFRVLDYNRFDESHLLHFDAGNVGRRSVKKPLFSSIVALELARRFQVQGLVLFDNEQARYRPDSLFSRV